MNALFIFLFCSLIGKAIPLQEVEITEPIMAYEIAQEEYDILVRIVEAEATGGTIIQKMNVASCVIARVESRDWPNDIKSVVFDNNGVVWQFSPISDGRYYKVKTTNSSRVAVDNILRHGLTHSCLFFCTKESYEREGSYHRKHLKKYFYDGMHIYCN